MGAQPKIGRGFGQAQTSEAEELSGALLPNVELGAVSIEELNKMDAELPPWERDKKYTADNTNARKFVECPDDWELRWLNPRVVDQDGMRDWRAVAASDPRITLKIPSMRAPDNTIRRGSHMGPFLAYMPKTWVLSRLRVKAELVRRRTQAAVDRQKRVTDSIRRGDFGDPRYLAVDSAQHPTHTIGDGRTMND